MCLKKNLKIKNCLKFKPQNISKLCLIPNLLLYLSNKSISAFKKI